MLLFTITPKYIKVEDKDKNKIGLTTTKGFNDTNSIPILGVGAVSATPVDNYNATAKLYLTYSEGDPQRNYNMFQVNTCGGFVPNRGGVPYIKKVINLERERLFQENSFSEHDLCLKAQHFKDLYKRSNTQQPLNFDRGSAMYIDATPYAKPLDPTFIAPQIVTPREFELLQKNSELQAKLEASLEHLELLKKNSQTLSRIALRKFRVLSGERKAATSELDTTRSERDLLSLRNSELKSEHDSVVRFTEGKLVQANSTIESLRYDLSGLRHELTGLRQDLAGEVALKVRTNTEFLHIMQSTDAENVRRFEQAKLDNPYSGVRSVSASEGMWRLRRQIEASQPDVLTSIEEMSDKSSRNTFLQYVYRDAFKIYYNVTNKNPLQTRLPAEVVEQLSAGTAHSIKAVSEFIAAWIASGGGP